MPRNNYIRVSQNRPRNRMNALAGIPQIKNGLMNNLYMKVRTIRFFNIARADNYKSKEAHEGITYTNVEEQARATGQIGKSD